MLSDQLSVHGLTWKSPVVCSHNLFLGRFAEDTQQTLFYHGFITGRLTG